MSKFTDIVDSPWVNLSLYAESIPHLLHWDLAYLWILEKHPSERPVTWEEPINAWKYLVSQLLMDQLTIEKVAIDPPLIEYTKPFGLDTVSFLKIRDINEPVGVLSPVVLVRPLPDYKRTSLSDWRAALSDPGENDSTKNDLKHLIAAAVESLQHQGGDSFATRLGKCIETEFAPEPTGVPANTRPVQYSFLERLGWSFRQDIPNIRNVPIFVRSGRVEANLWIPRCENCRELLTRADTEPAIDVTSDVVTVGCGNCTTQHQFAADDFLVWFRATEQVTLWRRDGITSLPIKGFPPVPTSNRDELVFQWNPGPLHGELKKRFLKLRFPGRTLVERSINEISYTKVIVPGALTGDFKGLPFRNEWLSAVANLDVVRIEVDPVLKQLIYRNVKINGLPVEVDIRFGNVSIETDDALHVGLYPNPRLMPAAWKSYRAFAAGNHRDRYVMKQGSRSILPWLVHFDSGSPSAFSAETQDGQMGVTFRVQVQLEAPQTDREEQVNVGIDFGTTNTLVYIAPPNSSKTIEPEKFALRPSALSKNILWFGEAEAVRDAPIADFIPSATRGQASTDPYLIPTALWVGTNGELLRWDATPPIAGMTPNGDFKSNDPTTPPLRLAYLKELMFLTVPQMIRQGAVGKEGVKLNLGFAFPLAFGFRARQEMGEILHKIKIALEASGCKADVFSISESRACVRAFGKPRPNEHYLVADMGGGTLDLALFTARATGEDPTMHQIGSLRYAGEDYVRAFADQGQQDVWTIRDAIASGRSWQNYGGNPEAGKILHRFVAYAFEFLRTMLMAFRQKDKTAAVRLILVGNGWHLADAFSRATGQQGSPAVFEDHYTDLVKKLGVPDLNLDPYLRMSETPPPSSKHLVVIGALKNSWDGEGRRELNYQETELPKLPAGRGMQLGTNESGKRFEWHDLVGDGITLESYSLGELQADSVFFLDEMAPLSESWRKHLLEQFRCKDIQELPYPEERQIRDELEPSIQSPPPRVGKGPLQIILEQSWVRRLIRRN
ncbi:MAG TPA: hypothetical protein VJV03_05090 [Pyrinomonadaceae bacterium]|nr:hypothetical protein [Pyrinomonadaceae bacterium]